MDRDKKYDLYYLDDEERDKIAQILETGSRLDKDKARSVRLDPSIPGFVIGNIILKKLKPLGESGNRPDIQQIVDNYEKIIGSNV